VARAILPRAARNWLRKPFTSARWGLLDLQAKVGVTRDLEIREGWHVRSHPGAYEFAYHLQCDDSEQAAEFDQFVSHCRPGMRLLDIGAHFGLFSLAAIHFGGPTASAVAVDPSPMAVRIIRHQARANGLTRRIEVIEASVGAQSGQSQMVAGGIESAGYYVRPGADHLGTERTVVRTVTVDQLCCAANEPTHLKIDVEGFEADVLLGARVTLSSPTAPVVFLELHCDLIRQAMRDAAEPLDLLADAGYSFFDVHGLPVDRCKLLARPIVRLLAQRAAAN
jgi:FkbM family methyltransferase